MLRPAPKAAFSLSLFLSLALASGRSALAGESDDEDPVPAPRTTRRTPDPLPAAADRTWYGWQILVADAGAITCALITDQGVCLAGVALSGPIVHAAHGNPGRGLASLGMRVALPILGALIGSAAANCPDRTPSPPPPSSQGDAIVVAPSLDLDFCGLGEAAIGLMAGAATAMVADGLMAFSDRAPEPAPERRRAGRFAITPRLAVGQNNLAMGLSGTF